MNAMEELSEDELIMRDDFFGIIDALSERNITVSYINTNSSFITEGLLNEFLNRNVRPIFVMSYDGYGCHDWLRGINGAEEKVNNAFRLCIEIGFPVKAVMVIHKGNSHTQRESINHLASLGVPSITTLYAADVGEWLKRNGQVSMSIEDMCNMYLEYLPIPALAASTGLNPEALFAATVIGSQSSAISPFSSGGSLIMASCGKEEERVSLFNRLMFIAVPTSVILCAVFNYVVTTML
jgi:hypothetical protein